MKHVFISTLLLAGALSAAAQSKALFYLTDNPNSV